MKVVVAHPTANNFTRALLQSLLLENSLFRFYTTVATFTNHWSGSLQTVPFLKELQRRQFDPQLKPFTRTFPLLEVGRQIASKLGIDSLTRHESGRFSVDSVYRHLDKVVATDLINLKKQGVSTVYAYEDGALATFQMAKKFGMQCVYELPIAYWETSRKLLAEEAIRLPEWAVTLGGGTLDSPQKLERKSQELALADLVVVPSQFVQDSLPAWAADKPVVVAPFGTPTIGAAGRAPETYSPPNRPLRVLFVGSMGQRKGLGDLFAAIRLLNRADIELVVLGSLQAPLDFYRQQLPNFTYEPGRPNEQVLSLMRTCDVFCLPSIVEGRALVMQEAMSQGLPLIVTHNTGGSDLVIEGETGFLIPIRSPAAIAEKISWFLEHRAQIPVMGRQAQIHAQSYTWASYSNRIIGEIEYRHTLYHTQRL
jgi:glycosyltransferase involved in cell wall biosynthesis